MASYNEGKAEVCDYILKLAKKKPMSSQFRILDVGACDGKWADLIQHSASLGYYPAIIMDAVEAFVPNAIGIETKYNHVYPYEIQGFTYRRGVYDLALFGDVIEHMTVQDAQKVLTYALSRCSEVIVGVPFQYPQGAIYGNPYEIHIQDDLTPALFEERYPGFEMFLRPKHDYAYYRRATK